MIDVSEYLNQELVHMERDGYDKYGKIESVSSNFMGRLESASSQNRGLQAKPLDYDVEVWMEPDQSMAVDDIISYDSIEYRVIQVNEYRDRDGKLQHKTAMCQKYV